MEKYLKIIVGLNVCLIATNIVLLAYNFSGRHVVSELAVRETAETNAKVGTDNSNDDLYGEPKSTVPDLISTGPNTQFSESVKVDTAYQRLDKASQDRRIVEPSSDPAQEQLSVQILAETSSDSDGDNLQHEQREARKKELTEQATKYQQALKRS